MLSKPRHGWATITIEDWSDRLSYLDDVPFMLLDAMIWSCREHQPASVRFDAEGYDYIIVFDWLYTYIIELKDKTKMLEFHIDRDDLAKQLIRDIKNALQEWAGFVDYGDMTGVEKEYRKLCLESKCMELEELLPSDDYKILCLKDEN